jgi:multiple sugar transport system permease protein
MTMIKSLPVSRVARSHRPDTLWGNVFLIPWFLGFFGLTLGPMLVSLYLSFTDFPLLSEPTWVGAANYVKMFTDDPRFLQSVKVTLLYVAISVPIELAFALFLALVLNRGINGIGTYRAIYYIPSLLGGSVAVAVMWRQIFSADGLVNRLLAMVGVQGPSWISTPDFSLYTLIALTVWQFGSPMVIFLAGLRQIPAELYDSAAVDGAGRWRLFVNITLPMLTPIILFNLILRIISAFQSFTGAYIVSGGSGGPADSTLFYTLYLYQEGFTNYRMGYASALAWLMFVTIGAVTAVNFFMSRFWVHYEDAE